MHAPPGGGSGDCEEVVKWMRCWAAAVAAIGSGASRIVLAAIFWNSKRVLSSALCDKPQNSRGYWSVFMYGEERERERVAL